MHRVDEPNPPAAPKQIFCSLTGVTWTCKSEGVWANGLIYATMGHYAGADPETKFRRPEHAFMTTLRGASDWTRVRVSGSPVYEGRLRTGCISYRPADTEGQAWHRNYNLERLYLLVGPSVLQSCEFSMAPLDIPSITNAYDPLLQSVLWSLAREMRGCGSGLPSVYAEHAAGLLMAHLVHSAERRRSRYSSRAGLSATGLRSVLDFIEENLGQDISLTALAALTGTGVDVFARNFKASMGVPPYHYVLERRLLRAQALLTDGGKSIAEVAFEAGFSSQAHLTMQFSKAMHMSPAAYRAVHRE
jgi:AraC family transcriptional regulator